MSRRVWGEAGAVGKTETGKYRVDYILPSGQPRRQAGLLFTLEHTIIWAA